jgi:hypothetical protein
MEEESTELNRKGISKINNSRISRRIWKNICHTLVEQTEGCQANFYIINSIKDTNQLYKIGVC